MCKAFSCIVDPVGKVTWKRGVDSHTDLAKLGGYADRVLGEFAKIEITPNNKPARDVAEYPGIIFCG